MLKEGTAVLTEVGTPFLVDMINDRGVLCTHNASRETFEFSAEINAKRLKQHYIVRNSGCFGCPVACGKVANVARGNYAGRQIKMPEYETIYALGPMLDNHDIDSIINANGLCDLLGLDTVSMGVTLSFVAECLEKGVVSESDLGGTVEFGNSEGMIDLVKATAGRKGLGELLAMGSAKLADRFGKDAHKYLYATKGMEIPGHSARGVRALSLGYATATRGGTHHDSRPRYPVPDEDHGFSGQVEANIQTQHYTAVGDSLIMCRFTEERGLGAQHNDTIADVVNHVTGWDVDVNELDVIGERIYNIERMIGVRRGLSRRDDTLPWRSMNEPIPDGPAKGRYCSREELDRMLDEYYCLRGWSKDGIPTTEKLSELGLL